MRTSCYPRPQAGHPPPSHLGLGGVLQRLPTSTARGSERGSVRGSGRTRVRIRGRIGCALPGSSANGTNAVRSSDSSWATGAVTATISRAARRAGRGAWAAARSSTATTSAATSGASYALSSTAGASALTGSSSRGCSASHPPASSAVAPRPSRREPRTEAGSRMGFSTRPRRLGSAGNRTFFSRVGMPRSTATGGRRRTPGLQRPPAPLARPTSCGQTANRE